MRVFRISNGRRRNEQLALGPAARGGVLRLPTGHLLRYGLHCLRLIFVLAATRCSVSQVEGALVRASGLVTVAQLRAAAAAGNADGKPPRAGGGGSDGKGDGKGSGGGKRKRKGNKAATSCLSFDLDDEDADSGAAADSPSRKEKASKKAAEEEAEPAVG